MINEENLYKMYETVIDEKALTTKELNNCGFNSKDLTKLVENGTLERMKRGSYSLSATHNLVGYAKYLIMHNQPERATTCFEVCYKLNPKDTAACMNLLLRSIQNKEYEKAFEYLKNLYKNDNEVSKSNTNFYLYLLNLITEIPKQFQEYTKNLSYEDFKDKRFDNACLCNMLRISASNQKFKLALYQCNQWITEQGAMTIKGKIIKVLLNQAAKRQIERRNAILGLLIAKDYRKLKNYLEKIQEKQSLSEKERYILSLTQDLLEILTTKTIPEIKFYNTDTTLEAIDSKNYKLALSLSASYNKLKKNNAKFDPIYILLMDINNEISKLKAERVEQDEMKIKPPLNNPSLDTKEEKTEQAFAQEEETKEEIEEVTATESVSAKKEVEVKVEAVTEQKSDVSRQGTNSGSKKKKKAKQKKGIKTEEQEKGNNTKEKLQTQRNWLQDAKVLQYKAQVYDEYSALYGSVLSPEELENITNNAFLNYDLNEGISMELSVRFKMETDILVTLANKYRKNPDSEEALNSLIVIENIFKKKIKEKYPHYEDEKIAMAIETVFTSYTGEKAFFIELALKLRN